ncbi:MAG: TetR/AcrR family transcriptional regulator [Anaerolineales bacterium]|nr:TetR/AcrR family transcriptional regulator [Anaerolineales bacterium]
MDEALLSKGERTRQAILEAAYELFIEQGYTATSMRQIAKRADLALSGIYNHFHNKEAIFAELLLERHPYRQVLPILLKTPTGEIEAFVRTAAHGMVAELSRQSGFIKLMLIEIVEFNACHMPQVISHVFPEVLPIIERFVQAGHCLHEIPPVVLFSRFYRLVFFVLSDRTDRLWHPPGPEPIKRFRPFCRHFSSWHS